MAEGYPVTVIKPFDEREIQSIAAPFVNLANAWSNKQNALTAKQKAIRNREATAYENAYKQLGQIESVDYATYDENMRNFFDGKVDDYVKIKNNIDSGVINPQEGARSLAYISNMIDEYKTIAPKVLAQAKFMMENGAGGTNELSKLNDPNLEILFSKLLEGSGEVTLAENEKGKMYLKGAGKIDGQDWNYDLNLSEFDKINATGDSLAVTTISLEDLGLNEVSQAAIAASTQTELKENNTSVEYVNVDQVRTSLSNSFSNSIDELMRGESFASVWADQIYESKTVDELRDENLLWDPADKAKVEKAKTWLIDKAIETQVPIQNQVQFSQRDENGLPVTTSEIEGVDEVSSTFGVKPKVKQPDIDKDKDSAIETFQIYSSDPVGSFESTFQKVGGANVDGNEVSRKGNIITVKYTYDGDEKPTITNYDLDNKKDFEKYFENLRISKGMFEGTAVESQNKRQDFTEEVKKQFVLNKAKKKTQVAKKTITDDFSPEDFASRNDMSGMSDNEKMTAYKEEVEKRVRELEEAVNYKVK